MAVAQRKKEVAEPFVRAEAQTGIANEREGNNRDGGEKEVGLSGVVFASIQLPGA